MSVESESSVHCVVGRQAPAWLMSQCFCVHRLLCSMLIAHHWCCWSRDVDIGLGGGRCMCLESESSVHCVAGRQAPAWLMDLCFRMHRLLCSMLTVHHWCCWWRDVTHSRRTSGRSSLLWGGCLDSPGDWGFHTVVGFGLSLVTTQACRDGDRERDNRSVSCQRHARCTVRSAPVRRVLWRRYRVLDYARSTGDGAGHPPAA